MQTEPSKKRARPSREQSVELLEANELGPNVAKPPTDGKSGPFVDFWIESRINYLAPRVTDQAGPVARRFLREARARYHQYRACGYPRLRYLCWSALDIVADHLVHPPGGNAK